MTKRLRAVCMMGVVASAIPGLAAERPTCSADAVTDRYMCYLASEVREADGIRTAPLLTGGPRGVRRTPYYIAANCATGVMHLKDRDGVSFGGADRNGGTQMSRDMQSFICAEVIKTKKGKPPKH